MISEAWRNSFSTDYLHDTRLYFNPRGIEYPAISDTLTYSQDEGLGSSWCASGGAASYLIDCTQPTVVSCMVKVQAASNYIFRWYTAAGNLFGLYTNASSQVYGNFNNGTGYITTAVTIGTAWVKVDIAIISNQLTLWVNNTKIGPVAIGAIAAQLPILYVNAATAKIKHLRILKYSATEAQITSMFSGVPNSEVYGDFAKRSLLSERCNITKYHHSYTLDKSLGYNATNASVQLHNQTGVFTDDAATGCAGYWKGDTLPDIPDDPAGVTNLWSDFTAVPSGWSVNSGTPTSSFSGGIWNVVANSSNEGYYRTAVSGTLKIRLRVLAGSVSLGKTGAIQTATSPEWKVYTVDFTTAGIFAVYSSSAIWEISHIYIGTGGYLSKDVDNSGNGMHGTPSGVTPVDTIWGRAISFDGINDYVALDINKDNWTGTFTWSFRVQGKVTRAASQVLYSRYLAGAGNYGIRLQVSNGNNRAYMFISGDGTNYAEIAGPAGTEITADCTLAFEFVPSTSMRILKDGIEIASLLTGVPALAFWSASQISQFGALGSSHSNVLDGWLSAPMYYKRALTASEHQKYAAGTLVPYFAPEYNQYNGTEFDEFLQRRTGLWIEEYLTSAYSIMPVFHGWAAPGAFARASSPKSGSEISIKAIDFTQDLGRRSIRKARYWEDLLIADASDSSNSLFHQIAYLGTKKEIYNYLCNSSFENATISNSWGVSGGTFTRTSGGLFGSYYGALATQGAILTQTCTIPLSSGERFTYQVLINGSATINIELDEYEGATLNGSSSQYSNVDSSDGWKLASITYDIIDSTSDRLTCKITLSNGATVGLDNAGLYYGEVKYGYINNTNDGTSGVCDYTQAMLGTYDIIGVHSDMVNYMHPWATVNPGDKVWDMLSSIGDASIAKYMRITNEDVLTLASNFTGTAETSNGAIQGTSGKILSLSSGIQGETANKVKVQGAYITKKPNIECVWEARASALAKDSTETGSPFSLTVANGDYFPLIADSPDGYEALYGDTKEYK